MLFARAATQLQQQLAAAVIELAAAIEAESRETGHPVTGVYRLKLEGDTITTSFERFHRTRKVHIPQTVVQS